jgi:inorganic triphosphatase YgiF
MAVTVRETERKYDLDEDTPLPRWSGLSGVVDVVGPEEQLLEAVYFDTADLRLAAAGVTLRRRRGGSDAGEQPIARLRARPGLGEPQEIRQESMK